MKKVIIVGGGLGGLATAVRLLHKGYKVTVIEKEDKVGGKINRFEKDGYKFDLTASILMTPKIYKDIFEYVNKDYKDYLDFKKLDVSYRVFYNDYTSYDFYSDMSKTTETIEKISKSSVNNYVKFIDKAFEKYTIAEKYFLKRNMDELKNFISIKNLNPGIKLAPFSTSEDFIKKYITNEKLLNYLLFQCMYVGVSPYNASNIYSLVPAITQIYGLEYLKGGMYSYIEALEKLINEMGGKVLTNKEVKEIIIEKNKVKGIRTRKDEINCDIVVCNADFPYAVTNLIKKEKFKDGYTVEKVKKLKNSCGVFMLYLGTNKKYPGLNVHNIVIGNEFRHNIEAPFRGKMPGDASLYIYCPSRIDTSMSNNDGEVINVMMRVPNLIEGKSNWDGEFTSRIRRKLINKLKELRGLEDIEEHIVVEEQLTPIDMEEFFNSYGGSAFGLSHTLSQTTYFRPHIKAKHVEGLYYAGESIHPGVGASIVLLGAEVVSGTIIKDNNRNPV